MNKNIYAIFIMAVVIGLLPLISATTLGNFKQNNCVNLIQTCANCTYSNITNVIYPNSSIAISNIEMTKSGTYYSYDYCSTSLTGTYIVTGYGNPDGTITVWNYDFSITPNGEEASIGKAVFYIGILAVLLFFLALCIYGFVEFDNLISRVAMFGLIYLLLIAITFIGWNMAEDFITSAPFLISMLRILFFVLIIGAFPLLIGAFAWYVLMLFRIKEIENLMKHGMSQNEAEERVNRRKRR